MTGKAHQLAIDWTACDGHGLCAELLPGLLDRDPWGFPLARDGSGGRLPVDEELLPHARRTVRDCPRLALLLDER